MKRQLPAGLTVEADLMSQFGDVAGQRMANTVQLRHPGSQFEPSGMQSAMSNQKARLDSLQQGTPLSTLYPFGGANILESFRTENFSPHKPMALPNREPATNVTTTIQVPVKPFTGSLDAVRKYELAIEYKLDPHKMDTMAVRHVGRMQRSPMTVLNPATWNYTLCSLQIRDVKENPEAYYLKTPWDYWKDWSISGVVEAEEMLDGSDSFHAGGLDPGSSSARAGGYKLLTMATKGPVSIHNYAGRNIYQGGKMYAIIKKSKIPGDYWLDSRPGPTTYAGRHSVDMKLPMIRDNKQEIFPYQMSFMCLPNGGPLPREATMYRNERGDMCYDAIVIYLGTIFSTPIDHEFMAITDFYELNAETKRREPINNGGYNDVRSSYDPNAIMYTKIILDCDDGIGAM